MTAIPVVREYECVGGPLDSLVRLAAPPPTRDRIYLVLSPVETERFVECSVVPATAGWKSLGYYELREDNTDRRGVRLRLWWHDAATWPPWLNAPLNLPDKDKPYDPTEDTD